MVRDECEGKRMGSCECEGEGGGRDEGGEHAGDCCKSSSQNILSLLPSLSPPSRLDIKSPILPNLIELLSDEECCVRVAAVETLVELVSFLDEGTLRSETVPLLMKFCEEALSAGDSTLLTVARLLGRICVMN